MSVVLYFGKINLISYEIHSVLNGNLKIEEIFENISNAIKDGVKYLEQVKRKNGEETYFEEIEYTISIKERNKEYINGYILKKSYLYYKEFSKIENKLVPQKIKNTEGVEFYYDIFNERVGYNTARRFGNREFLKAFEGILNNACEDSNLNYTFTVNQCTEGLNIDEIREELNTQQNIQKMTFKYQIPNPDKGNLDKIRENAEKTIKNFENANLAIKEVTYTSSSRSKGININSEIVQNELNQLDNLHSSIQSKNALSNGYIEVNTTDIYGVIKSTADKKPILKKIDSMADFKESCKEIIYKEVTKN